MGSDANQNATEFRNNRTTTGSLLGAFVVMKRDDRLRLDSERLQRGSQRSQQEHNAA